MNRNNYEWDENLLGLALLTFQQNNSFSTNYKVEMTRKNLRKIKQWKRE